MDSKTLISLLLDVAAEVWLVVNTTYKPGYDISAIVDTAHREIQRVVDDSQEPLYQQATLTAYQLVSYCRKLLTDGLTTSKNNLQQHIATLIHLQHN